MNVIVYTKENKVAIESPIADIDALLQKRIKQGFDDAKIIDSGVLPERAERERFKLQDGQIIVDTSIEKIIVKSAAEMLASDLIKKGVININDLSDKETKNKLL